MATTEHQKPYVTEQHKPLTYYGAYPYAYNNLKSIDEKVFHDELMDFKHTGHATTKIVNAYANLVSKAVLDNGTFKDSLVVYTPSKDIGGSNQRFHMVKEKLDKFHLHQEPDAIINTINKKSSVDPVTHKKDNHNILDGLVFDTEKIKGKKIILIDDILTKGEHARTITDELYKHGAADVKLVTLCITPPSQGHEDTRYRFGLTEAEQSKNLLKFNQEMKPDIYQKQLYNLDLKEREIPMNLVFDNENKAEKAKITPIANLLKDAYPKRLQEDNLNLAAETKSNVYIDNNTLDNKNNTNNSLNKSSNMAEEQKDQEKKQNTGVSTSFIGYANVAQQKDAQGNLKKVAEPTFTGRIKMEKLLNAPTTQYTDKNGKTGEWINLAVVVSPKAKESANNSSHMLITSRQGKEVEVNGKQVKFADVQSQYEIKIDKQSLLKAAKAAGIADDGSIDLKFGKKEGGVQLNPSQYPMITDKKNLEIFSNIHTTNSFENYKTSQQNLGKVGPNRYDDNYLGQSFGFQVKDKDGNLKVNANNDPVMMHNIKLDANKIKFLQECDHFGNVNLAIVKRDLSPEKLGEKGLKMVDGSNFPVNQYGIKQPNFFVIADPKVYKNGEPNANVVAVIKINKQELAALPHTTEDFKTKDGKQVHNEYIHISMDQFKNIKPNVKDYQFKGVEVKDSSNLTANVTSYNPQIAQQERKAWEDSHPRLNEAEFKAKLAAEKDMPNQYQAYSSAVKIMFASKLQNNPSQAQAQTQQQAQDDNQTKQKNSPKW